MTMPERPKRNLKPGSRQGSNGSTKNRPPKFGRCTSVYLSPLFSEEYRQLCEEHYGVSGSFRLNELMLADLAEMKGQTLTSQANITALEMQVANLISRTKKIKAFLTKLGVYSDLEDLTIKWRLDVESFGNTDSIIDKFLSYKLLSTDHFTKDDIELFVQLLSLVKEKTLKKADLDKLRLNRIRGTPAPVPTGSPPEPATVKADEAVWVSVASVSVEIMSTESQSENEIKKRSQGDMDRIAELLESAEGEDQTMVSVG
jgi:hypothetical protein